MPRSVLDKALTLIPEKEFIEKEGVLFHPLHNKDELKENIETCKIIQTQTGKKTKLLPVSKIPKVKNPDVSINGVIHEIKVNNKSTISAIDNELRIARKQADNIVLNVKSKINEEDLMKAIRDRLQRSDNIKNFILIYKGKVYETTRTAILEGGFKIE